MQNEKLLKWINERNMNDIYQCSYCKYIKKLRAWEMKKVKVFWKVLKKSCHQQKLMWIRSSFKTWILLRSFGLFAKENTCTTMNTRMFISSSKEPLPYVETQSLCRITQFPLTRISTYTDFSLCMRYWGNATLVETLLSIVPHTIFA